LANTLNNFFNDLKSEYTELSKQVKNIKDLDKNFLTYDQFKSTQFKYQTHPQAIYTSRSLNLPKQ
ncbi:16075_t:CDS:1, partial [Cetraspora pellucida]